MKLLFILFSCLLPFQLNAQERQTLEGKVMDALSGEPLFGAHLLFLKNGHGTTTDSLGTFRLKHAFYSPNDTIVISYVGYYTKKIVSEALAAEKINIQLMPRFALQEVKIKADKLVAEEFTSYSLQQLDIYQNPSAKADPLLAVNSLPASTSIDESASISLRGSSPEETTIFLNGVPVRDVIKYTQINGTGTFSIFTISLIKEVQVFPGNPPLEFSNSSTGLISLQSSEAIPKQNNYQLSLSLASVGAYTQQRLNKNSSLTVFANYQASGPFKFVNQEALKAVRAFSSGDGGLQYVWKGRKGSIGKLFHYSLLESYTFQMELPTFKGPFKQQKSKHFTAAQFRKPLGRGLLVFNQGVSYSQARFHHTALHFKLRLQDYYSSFHYQYVMPKGEWKAGLSYSNNRSTFRGSFPLYSYAVGSSYPSEEAAGKSALALAEAFLYGKYHFSKKWTGGGGIRGYRPLLQEGQSSWSSQLNIRYQLSRPFFIKAAAGNYHSFRLEQNQSGSLLHFQSRQLSFDMGYTKGKARHSAALFYRHTSEGHRSNEVNGVEISSEFSPIPQLHMQLSFTSLDADEQQAKITLPTKYDISYFIRGNLRYHFLPGWTFSTVFLFRQGSTYFPLNNTRFRTELGVYEPFYAGYPERLPPYRNIDISLSKALLAGKNSSLLLFCSVNNLLNFKNIRGYTHDFEYQHKKPLLFNQRTVYMGGVLNFGLK